MCNGNCNIECCNERKQLYNSIIDKCNKFSKYELIEIIYCFADAMDALKELNFDLTEYLNERDNKPND